MVMEHYYQDIPGFFWFEEAYRQLLRALPLLEPSIFVELGSYQGRSLAWLGVEVVNSGKPVTIHAVDACMGLPGGLQGGDLLLALERHILPLRGALGPRLKTWPARTVDVAAQFADESVDVVFVDADHSYDGCMADIQAWWPKLKPGGWMAGDDWMMYGVQRAVGEVFAPHYILGHGWSDAPDVNGGAGGYWPWWMIRKGGV